MILYLDTSAMVKRYFSEPFSGEVISNWKSADEIITSSAAYAEAMASFHRKKRDTGLDNSAVMKIIRAFHLDWQSFIRIEVADELNDYIDRIVERYPLRGFDAIHLASCLLVKERLPENILFMCFDQRLTKAARLEGLDTFPAPA